MTITVEDLVHREVYYCVSCLVADLAKIVPQLPYSVLKGTSLDEDDLRDLMQRRDYETAVDNYIDAMDRDDLVQALEEVGVEDERDEEDIRAAARRAATAEGGNPELVDEDAIDELIDTWPGILDADLKIKLFKHLEDEDEFETFANEHGIEPEYDDVYEHWIVSSWLAEKLEEKGEVVGEVAGLTIWGRCTTGQMISMDWVVQQIHKDLVEGSAE